MRRSITACVTVAVLASGCSIDEDARAPQGPSGSSTTAVTSTAVFAPVPAVSAEVATVPEVSMPTVATPVESTGSTAMTERADPCASVASAGYGETAFEFDSETRPVDLYWSDRAVAVDHVEGEYQRNAEPGFLDRDPLHLARLRGAPEIADRADPAGAQRRHVVARDLRSGDRPAGRDQGHLADFLLEGHDLEQFLDAGGRCRLRHAAALRLQVEISKL